MPYDATFTRLDTQALFDLKGPRAELRAWASDALPPFPRRPNTRTGTGNATLMFVGPDHWLLRADLTAEDRLHTALRPASAPPEISITCVSDTLAFFRIRRRAAADVLSIACPMDLHEQRFGPDGASFSEFFGLKALVTRCEGGFDIGVEQSFGPMVADHLTRALS